MKLIYAQPILHKSDLERLNWLLDNLAADEYTPMQGKVGFIRDTLLSLSLGVDFEVRVELDNMNTAIFNRRQTTISKDGERTIIPRDKVILNKKDADRIPVLVTRGDIDTDWEVYQCGFKYAIVNSISDFEDLGEATFAWQYVGQVAEAL